MTATGPGTAETAGVADGVASTDGVEPTGRVDASDAGETLEAAEAPDDRHDAVVSRRILTVPNALSISRILGSVVLVWLAWIGAEGWFIGVFLAFLFTDWLDGKLAILLHQRTVLGARLDTVGDGILYLCLLLGAPLLEPEFLRREWLLVTLMLVSHFAAAGASVIKFRRIPAYHTRAAKTCWLLVCVGTVTLLAGGPDWPARVALAGVILTNLQSIAMTVTLPRWEADVSSWWHARRLARASTAPAASADDPAERDASPTTD